MTVGTSKWKGLGATLHGENEFVQITAATDFMTLTRITSGTGDFFVCRDDGGTEYFVITSAGAITMTSGARLTLTSGYLNLGAAVTTAPTTGLTKGDLFLVWSANTTPVLGACYSTAVNGIKYISPFDTKTLGRTT